MSFILPINFCVLVWTKKTRMRSRDCAFEWQNETTYSDILQMDMVL